MKRVFVENDDKLVAKMFTNAKWVVVDDPSKADLIVFTGGADVSPMLYEQVKMPLTQCNPLRDQNCADIFFKYEGDTPMLGICRGAQFLNVMNGGELYQDVDNHCETHEAYDTSDGAVYDVTSTHHQMMVPTDEAEIIMVANVAKNKIPFMGSNAHKDDIEVVYYDESNCLCFQPHPEYVLPTEDTQKVFWEYVNQYLF